MGGGGGGEGGGWVEGDSGCGHCGGFCGWVVWGSMFWAKLLEKFTLEEKGGGRYRVLVRGLWFGEALGGVTADKVG